MVSKQCLVMVYDKSSHKQRRCKNFVMSGCNVCYAHRLSCAMKRYKK